MKRKSIIVSLMSLFLLSCCAGGMSIEKGDAPELGLAKTNEVYSSTSSEGSSSSYEGYSYSPYYDDIAFSDNQDGTCCAYGRYVDPGIRKLTIPSQSLSGKTVKDVSDFDELDYLEEVDLPSTLLDIQEGSFAVDTQLKKVDIKENLKTISTKAFLGCSSLSEIKLPDSLLTLGDYAFEDCPSLKEIRIPDKVKSLPQGIFLSCKSLKKVILPDVLESISSFAFRFDGLENIFIPKSVTRIESRAFVPPARKKITLYVEAESYPSTWSIGKDNSDIKFVYGAKRSDVENNG